MLVIWGLLSGGKACPWLALAECMWLPALVGCKVKQQVSTNVFLVAVQEVMDQQYKV